MQPFMKALKNRLPFTSARSSPLILLLVLLLAFIPTTSASAAAIVVTTTADSIDAAANCTAVTLASLPGPGGQTSLREAVCAANADPSADTITFSVNGTFVLTGAANEDNGGTGDLDIKQSLVIQGNGSANTILDGGGIERIFDAFPGSAITFDVSNLTVQNGDTRAAVFKEGGAMYLHNNVTTTLIDVQVRNNFSGANGAIENRGTLTIINSVIVFNQTIPAAGSVVGGGIRNAGSMTIDNTTIANNTVRGEGGGIHTTTAAGVVVNITDSTISGNIASVTGGGLGNGGGISTTGNQGTIMITNSTISGNRADNNGGGANLITPGGGTGSATLTNVTVTNNTADNDLNDSGAGGGLFQNTARITVNNTIIAGNFNSFFFIRDDISGAIFAPSSFNLVGDGTGASGITNGVNNNQVGSAASPVDPQVGPLANTGGSTQTHALLVGSPALDTGSNALCPLTDQRGVSRSGGGICDKGSYELVDTTPPDTTITANPTNPSASTSASFTFTGSDPGGSGVASFQCRLDGSAFSACTSPHTYTGLSDGVHTFQVRAVDASGNQDSTPASYAWRVDTTRPDTTITANPTNPTTSTSASFTFTGSDPGASGVASFQCQLDGGGFSACTSPRAYTGLSQGSHTFQVRAVDAAGNIDSTPDSYTWVVDTVAPETTITANPPIESSSTDAGFNFTGSDPGGSGVASFECQLDGGGFATCTSPRTYTGLSDGSHTFLVRAVDSAGNQDPTPSSYTWVVDTTPPDTIITATPPNPSASANASFSFTGSDPGGSGVASFQCQLDGGGFSACTSPRAYTGLSQGSHTFQARAVDAAGNPDSTPDSYTWVVDTVAPETTITANPPIESSSTDAGFNFTGSDPGGSGVASFQCQLDGGGYAACTSPRTYTGLGEGSHTFLVRAVDAVGNIDSTPAYYYWSVDTTEPDTTITDTPANPSADENPFFGFTGSDPNDGWVGEFQCQLDGGGFSVCLSYRYYSNLSDGSHTFLVRAVDVAGNIDSTPASYTWVIDTTGPDTTITIFPPIDSSSTEASHSFTGSDPGGSGVASFQCQLDGGGYAACTSPHTDTGLGDGLHTFQVRAVDAAGNPDGTPASSTWTVDTVAPDTTIFSFPANPSASADAVFLFDGSEDLMAGYHCQLDGGGWDISCSSPYPYSGLSDGSHTFQVRAYDFAGNIDPTPDSYTWVIDTTPPDTTITANPANSTTSADASFSFAGSDGSGSGVASFQCQLDGGGFSACTSPRAYTGLSEDSHTFQVRAVDVLGNQDSTPASYTWVIDTTAPTVAFASAAPDPTSASPIPVTVTFSESVSGFTAADISSGSAAVSNFAGSGASYTFDLVPAGPGLVTADIAAGVAQDAAGNPNTPASPFSRTFIAPEITVLGNGIVITSGDTTPSLADHTDFGSIAPGETVTRTFTITNSGVADLIINGSPLVLLSGPGAADFSVIVDPVTPVISNTSTTFQVRFTPSVEGLRVVTVTLVNTDSDENPYTFAISGTGTGEITIYIPIMLNKTVITPD